MSYFIDGNIEESTGKGKLKKRASKFIDSLPKRISLGKLKAITYGDSENLESILETSCTALLYLSDVFTYSRIEFAKQKSTTTPGNLDQLEVINKFYFFISMIGYIDKSIESNTSSMEHHSQFIDLDEYSAEAYHNSKILIKKLKKDRQKIIDAFRKTVILKHDNSNVPDSFDSIIDTIPMYKEFGNLYKNISEIYPAKSVYLTGQFINAYTSGYMSSCDCTINESNAFFEYLDILNNHISKNEEKVKQKCKKNNNKN